MKEKEKKKLEREEAHKCKAREREESFAAKALACEEAHRLREICAIKVSLAKSRRAAKREEVLC